MDDIDKRMVELVGEERARIERLTDSGFPFVDAELFERNPGVAASLRDWLVVEEPPGISQLLVAPEGISGRHRYEDMAGLLDHLRSTHRPQHWYRGQQTVHRTLYVGRPGRLALHDRRLELLAGSFECMMPSEFRRLRQGNRTEWNNYRHRPALEPFAGVARAILASGHPQLERMLIDFIDHSRIALIRMLQPKWNFDLSAQFPLASGTTAERNHLDFISLAQHYQYMSVMVDVSRDIDVATWFATHDWNGERPKEPRGKTGVIYRFDGERLASLPSWFANGWSPTVRSHGLFGVADISERFKGIADRPRAQHGGSLLGMESLLVNFELVESGTLEIFHFDQESVRESDLRLGTDDIRPPGDPGLQIFRPGDVGFSEEPLKPQELEPLFARHQVRREEAERTLWALENALI